MEGLSLGKFGHNEVPVSRKRQDKKKEDFILKYREYILVFFALIILCLTSVTCFKLIYTTIPKNGQYKEIGKLYSVYDTDKELENTKYIIPKANVYYHGSKVGEMESEVASVAEIIEHFNIVPGENDVINFNLEDTIYYGMDIRIDEVTYEEVIDEEIIPYTIKEIPSQTIPKGTREIIVKGEKGSIRKLNYTKYINGVRDSSETMASEITKKPVTEEVYVGVGGTFIANDGNTYDYSYYVDVTATAYTHNNGKTASGTVAAVGKIAVDPKIIPLRSKCYVTGNYMTYGFCDADDTGGFIKGKRIDLCMNTESECTSFGRKSMRVYIIE